MTLIGAILKKVQSKDNVNKKYWSPPPEVEESLLKSKKKRKDKSKYGYIKAVVDSTSPDYDANRMTRSLPEWRRRTHDLYLDNARMLIAITNAYLSGGKVDSHWNRKLVNLNRQYYDKRRRLYKNIKNENERLYKRLQTCNSRLAPTKELQKQWIQNKHDIVHMAKKKFVLFPLTPEMILEDSAFNAPEGFLRPKVYITLRMQGYSTLGTLVVELFTDVCPLTCQLFLELLDGDGLGYGYVGTRFFRKVPHLYWSGGDVVYDNGFGCYAQRGRLKPIPAENYHYPHSIPGLLSMRVSSEGDVCGAFNITFKALHQFDLRNVVFGRVIRPCPTFDVIRTIGVPLSSYPVVEMASTKRHFENRWINGSPNTRLPIKYQNVQNTQSANTPRS